MQVNIYVVWVSNFWFICDLRSTLMVLYTELCSKPLSALQWMDMLGVYL